MIVFPTREKKYFFSLKKRPSYSEGGQSHSSIYKSFSYCSPFVSICFPCFVSSRDCSEAETARNKTVSSLFIWTVCGPPTGVRQRNESEETGRRDLLSDSRSAIAPKDILLLDLLMRLLLDSSHERGRARRCLSAEAEKGMKSERLLLFIKRTVLIQ